MFCYFLIPFSLCPFLDFVLFGGHLICSLLFLLFCRFSPQFPLVLPGLAFLAPFSIWGPVLFLFGPFSRSLALFVCLCLFMLSIFVRPIVTLVWLPGALCPASLPLFALLGHQNKETNWIRTMTNEKGRREQNKEEKKRQRQQIKERRKK